MRKHVKHGGCLGDNPDRVSEILKGAAQNVRNCVRACLMASGGYFEHFVKSSLKTQILSYLVIFCLIKLVEY